MNYFFKQIISLVIITGLALTIMSSATYTQAQKPITNQMQEALEGNGGEEIALPGLGGDKGKAEVIAGKIIQAFISIFGIIFLGLMVYGGYKWMIAQGREEELKKAKDIIRSSIIGLAIVLSAYAIAMFVVSRFYQAAQGA